MNFSESISPEKNKTFVPSLMQRIIEDIQSKDRLKLDVDYRPCVILSELAKNTGIKASNSPLKTNMTIEIGYVAVRYGYGSETQILFETKIYWERQLQKAQDSFAYYQKKLNVETNDELKKEYQESIDG